MTTEIQTWCTEVGLGLGLGQVKPADACMLELEGIHIRVPNSNTQAFKTRLFQHKVLRFLRRTMGKVVALTMRISMRNDYI